MAERSVFVTSLFLAAILWTAPSLATTSPDQELWYVVEVGGETAGWMVSRELVQEDSVTTESHLELTLKRGAMTQKLELESRFVETRAGQPVSAWTRQHLGTAPLESRYTFTPEQVLLEQGPEGQAREVALPRPAGPWLTPAKAQERLEQELAAGKDRFSYRTLDPLLGVEPVELDWRLLERDVSLTVAGNRHLVSRWEQRQSLAPQVVTVVELDAAARVVRSSTQIMGMAMTVTLTDEETALRPPVGPEILVRTFIIPDRPIPRPRHLERAVYRLSIDDGDLPELPSIGDQRVEARGDHLLVTVALGSGAQKKPQDIDRSAFLAPSAYLDFEDPRLRSLLDQLRPELPEDDEERALFLRRFVHQHLTRKDLGSIFATAAEVAASRAGDCTEHAVLLAALLRASGIPARTVTGVVYVEHFAGATNAFAYHMWSQAWIDSHWLDLDATLDEARFDAAHIALGTVSLNDDRVALQEMASLVPLMGRLRIAVLDYADQGER